MQCNSCLKEPKSSMCTKV